MPVSLANQKEELRNRRVSMIVRNLRENVELPRQSLFYASKKPKKLTEDDIYRILSMNPLARKSKDVARVAHFLRKYKAFQKFSAFVLAEICKVMTTMNYPKNTSIFVQGQEGDCFYIIWKGAVEIYIANISDASTFRFTTSPDLIREKSKKYITYNLNIFLE
jgi:hypothetical protein